jgi:hypothetical protein
MEIEITLAIIFLEILVLRWIINRMPILDNLPDHNLYSKKTLVHENKLTLNKEHV